MPRPEVLVRADASGSLPRLGGMARPDGVVIVSERFWAFARRDGKLIEGRMPSTPASLARVPRARSSPPPPRRDGKLIEGRMPSTPASLARVPLARGLARLAMSVAPLFRRSGGGKRGGRR